MARVLIVGAGIAGDTLAVLLGRQGWDVVVAEIAPMLRTGGQVVDLRGGSRDVLARMGVLEDCLRTLVFQRGMAWVDSEGETLAAMPVKAFGGQGFVSREELLRTDLARVIHDSGNDRIEYRFGETVETLTDTDDGVDVEFAGGAQERFDLVVGADGTHSRVRALRWGAEENFSTDLGVAHAWFTLSETASTPTTDRWFRVHNAPGGRMVEARPGHDGTQQVGLSFRIARPLPPRNDRDAQVALLAETFRDVGWRAEEIVNAAATADDFACDVLTQISVPQWSRGRVVLLGDSAWCSSPLSGLGTAMALLGAETLANQLGDLRGDLAASLSAYEGLMRPRTEGAAKLMPGRVAMYVPRTRRGIRASAALIRAIQWPVIARLFGRLMSDRGHTIGDQIPSAASQ